MKSPSVRRALLPLMLLAVACGDDDRAAAVDADSAGDGTETDVSLPPLPIVLATGQVQPLQISVDEASVYWAAEPDGTNVHEIWRVAKDGTGDAKRLAETIVCTFGPSIGRILTDSVHVYWTTECQVARVDKRTGGEPETSTGASGARDLAADDVDLYALTSGALVTASKQSFAFSERVPGLTEPISIALVGSTLYFATLSASPPGQVFSMASDGSTPTPLATAPWTFDLTADSQGVYWIQGNDVSSEADEELIAWSAATQETRVLVPEPIDSSGLRSHAGNIYWIDRTTAAADRIMRVPNGGGTASVMASDTAIAAVAVDDQAIYWTNSIEGTVKKLLL